jgi:integrase/recombinase XerD
MEGARMLDLALVAPIPDSDRLIELTVATCISPHTRRMYTSHLRRFIASGQPLNREGVAMYLQAQRNLGSSPATISSVVTAIRKLATEAKVRGLLTRDELEQITSIIPGKQYRTRAGMWLTIDQVRQFLALPDRKSWWGRRDAAILACMVGCGFRRSEMATLPWSCYQMREGRLCFVDFTGKGRKLRTVPVPSWAQQPISEWQFTVDNTADADIPLYNPYGVPITNTQFDRKLVAGGIKQDRLYAMLRNYGRKMGLELAPHDIRRTLAQLLRKAGAPLEQIQHTLGHETLTTTMAYLGSRLELAPGEASVDQIALGEGK